MALTGQDPPRRSVALGRVARTLIRNGIVLPMTGGATVLDPGSVLVDGDTIVAVGPVDAVDADPRAAADGTEVVDATGHAVIPGLHNCHMHSGLLRGTAESLSLWDWLRTYVDPAHRALTPEIARVASLQCYAEGLLAGTTSVMDMWRFMEGSAAVAERLGIRATLVPYVADEAGYDYFESIGSNRALLESVGADRAGGRVRAWVGLEHLLYCTEGCFAAARGLAQEFDTGLHTHSSETDLGGRAVARALGRRPVEVFHRREVLGPRTVIAHCVWLDDPEIELLASTGTAVAHCPCSNMKLASGPARVADLRAAGVVVGLGTRRREGEQQPRPPRGDEVRVAAAEARDARPDGRRPVGRPRAWRRSTVLGHWGWPARPAPLNRASGRPRDGVARGPAHHAGPPRTRLQRRRPPRVLGLGS